MKKIAGALAAVAMTFFAATVAGAGFAYGVKLAGGIPVEASGSIDTSVTGDIGATVTGEVDTNVVSGSVDAEVSGTVQTFR